MTAIIVGPSLLKILEVEGVQVDSGVSDQPLSLEETIRGAKTRAKLAFQDCKYSIGLESRIMHLPESEEKYMDICICAIYDGRRYHIGTSCGYRLPNDVSYSMIDEGLNLNQAMKKHGITVNPRHGAAEGSVGLLTNGRIYRKEHCKQALITALISLEKSEIYQCKLSASFT